MFGQRSPTGPGLEEETSEFWHPGSQAPTHLKGIF